MACRETHVAPRRLCRWPETPPSTPDESGATSPSEEGEGYSLRFETVSQRSPEAGEENPFRLQAVSQRKFKGEGAGAPCLPRIPPCLATPDGAQRRSGVQGPQATFFGSALRLRSGQAPGPRIESGAAKMLGFREIGPGRQSRWNFGGLDRRGGRAFPATPLPQGICWEKPHASTPQFLPLFRRGGQVGVGRWPTPPEVQADSLRAGIWPETEKMTDHDIA